MKFAKGHLLGLIVGAVVTELWYRQAKQKGTGGPGGS